MLDVQLLSSRLNITLSQLLGKALQMLFYKSSTFLSLWISSVKIWNVVRPMKAVKPYHPISEKKVTYADSSMNVILIERGL
jgi:hypothetical protein